LPPSVRAKTLITTGPYQFVRHPIYSAFIWSGTGIMALTYKSWLLIIFVIPIHIFWVWHVQKEEKHMIDKFGSAYKDYINTTGQFFPRFTVSEKN
jgi:protein-S-isoprenylcysteine O-methyltransferase Ste14